MICDVRACISDHCCVCASQTIVVCVRAFQTIAVFAHAFQMIANVCVCISDHCYVCASAFCMIAVCVCVHFRWLLWGRRWRHLQLRQRCKRAGWIILCSFKWGRTRPCLQDLHTSEWLYHCLIALQQNTPVSDRTIAWLHRSYRIAVFALQTTE